MPDQSSAATEHAILQEITAPLEALPDDPLSVIDADFPTTLRGYDRVAVDEYVEQTRRLVAEMQATRSPEAAVRRALERVGEQISGILQRAHDTAEQITAQSRSEAEDRLEQARGEADQIMTAAEERVRDLDADTDRIWLERQRIVADAEDLAASCWGWPRRRPSASRPTTRPPRTCPFSPRRGRRGDRSRAAEEESALVAGIPSSPERPRTPTTSSSTRASMTTSERRDAPVHAAGAVSDDETARAGRGRDGRPARPRARPADRLRRACAAAGGRPAEPPRAPREPGGDPA